jgi:ABC-type multidrug transport system ATPase subunit
MDHKRQHPPREDIEEQRSLLPKKDNALAIRGSKQNQDRPGVKVTFNNLEYEIELKVAAGDSKSGKTEMKKSRIIKNASGYVLPGQTLFIMGATGAGKTTLLNMISDRTCVGKGSTMRREVLINDSAPLDHTNFGRFAAYVMQDDILFNFFTCREALTFASRLKLNLPVAEQDERINKLIEDFDLTEFADDQIGHVQGMILTPSQVKRISIAESLIIDPAVLLLDEPTSGLDSIQALNLVKILRAQAARGKAVILTIH